MITVAQGGLSAFLGGVLGILWLVLAVSGVLWVVVVVGLIQDSVRRHFIHKRGHERRLEPDVEFLRNMHIRP